MSFIGEAAISMLLEVLMGKLIDSALNFVADHKELKQQLKQWQSILPGIQSVLNDAEEKQIKHEGVKNWLDDLQDLAYDVDDILDEFSYEALRLKLQTSPAQASTSNVRKLIPTCCTGSSFTPTSFLFNNSMIPKMKEITARLNDLTARRTSLGLSEMLSQASSSNGKKPRPLQQTSVIDETVAYVGRQNEKREMLDLLKSSNNSEGVFVLSIIGMGGMGKTTLAQHVYNDAESFDHKAWVCVSDEYDAVNIARTILKSIDPDSSIQDDFNLLQVKLKEKLSGKRFLLVLDDIWNESYNDWTILRSPFGAGTKIIVTTRLQKVSSNVDPVKAFHLDKLSHDDCSSILTQHAFKARNFDRYPQLKEVGEKLVRRCDGLPLAAKAIGSLLRGVNDPVEWERIYESEIWDEEQCGIVPALRLSYHHLPSHLKRCFAYCSIFPKDYEFEEENIILLWRAEGFLQQKAKRQIKDVGKQYFQDLVSRSFFQISGNDQSRFVMHDLINDLAQLVAGEICSKLEGDKQQMFSNRTRHSSYIVSKYDTVKKFEAFHQVNSLRTFLPLKLMPYYSPCYLTNFVLDDLLRRLGYLRVLSLCGYEITELPDDVFENLKHLHYLNFSYTQIKRLPDSVCTLYHLETLILRGCYRLQELPSEMENLQKLHYLDIRGASSIKRMPYRIGKLSNIEMLSDFVIGEINAGHHIGELKNLLNLRGDFRLQGLDNVDSRDAVEAKLNEKMGINRLELEWSIDFKKAMRKKEVEEGVLDSLLPPKKLEQLVIKNYGGTRFSTWISDPSFKNMLSLELHNCKNCKSLPSSIGRLPMLKHVSVIGLDEVHKVGVELFGENQSKAFASLETLCFERMPNWEEWDTCEGNEQGSKFPCLRKLSIRGCPRLLGRLPTRLPSLQTLEISHCTRLVVSISSFPSLRELSVVGCEELVDECWNSSVAEEVTCLQGVTLSGISELSISADRMISRFANSWDEFEIWDSKALESLAQNGFAKTENYCPKSVSLETKEEVQPDKLLPGVERLGLWICETLDRLPNVLHAFKSITEMRISNCPGLVCFAESNLPPTLKKLVIKRCKKLKYWVDEKEDNHKSMSSSSRNRSYCRLEHLEIGDCESLICISSRADICNGLLHLYIRYCSKLRNLFSNAKLPIKLKHLEIQCCPMLECIAQDFHETIHLQYVAIGGAEKLQTLPRGLDKLSHLQEFVISGCSSLGSFEESGLLALPTTNLLTVLFVENCSKFGVLPKFINNFSSLRELTVSGCSPEISFPEESFPTNLTSLEISNAPKLYTSLVQWGFNRLTSLQQLRIGGQGCSNVVSFPEQRIGMMLPPSLIDIWLTNFENLEFMWSKGFQHLTSLQQLEIHYCPKLKSLPEKDMLLSLGVLQIYSCPWLSSRRGQGREWSKIAHIPYVGINHETVLPREGRLD